MVKKRKPIGNRPTQTRPAQTRPTQTRHTRNRHPQTGHGAAAGGEWLYGTHAVAAALANPARTLHRLLFADPEAETPPGLALRPEIVTREQITAMLPEGAVHQGFALLADALTTPEIEEFCAAYRDRDRAAIIVLDQVTDPQNVGAVLRSAAVFGAGAVVVSDRHAAPVTGVLAKAASGALETVPLIRVTNISRAIAALKSAGFWCAGLDAAASTALADADLAGKTALVIGAEGRGLRRLTRENCDLLVRIPAAGAIASLNVSNAAAVALYELTRQPRQQ